MDYYGAPCHAIYRVISAVPGFRYECPFSGGEFTNGKGRYRPSLCDKSPVLSAAKRH
jgi:hypothetical protein